MTGLPEKPSRRCANLGGLSLHADVAVPARDRERLERQCRYAARPPLARLPDGRLLYWPTSCVHAICMVAMSTVQPRWAPLNA